MIGLGLLFLVIIGGVVGWVFMNNRFHRKE